MGGGIRTFPISGVKNCSVCGSLMCPDAAPPPLALAFPVEYPAFVLGGCLKGSSPMPDALAGRGAVGYGAQSEGKDTLGSTEALGSESRVGSWPTYDGTADPAAARVACVAEDTVAGIVDLLSLGKAASAGNPVDGGAGCDIADASSSDLRGCCC
mmetsp:Transcript_66878/g.118845  ORF Transcript_66878/g.118845 Transcript_66878/m.118845 type:complete len:155 (+) Transcript_66878:357-821(+)